MLRKEWASSLPLTGNLMNRFEKERKRSGFMAERLAPPCHPRAAIMSMKPDGLSIFVRDRLHWLHPIRSEEASLVDIDVARSIYIGERLPSHENVFVADASHVSEALIRQGEWTSVPHFFNALDASAPPAESALFSLCISTYQWVQITRFCVRCGGAMSPVDGGLCMKCSTCSNTVYPGVTPAIIVAVLDGKGHILLSQRRRRSNSVVDTGKVMRTVLSGFVSQGESMEETVVREVEEESQAAVTTLRYVGSQPWPFPHELMCAYYAVAPASGALVAQEDELVSVAWVSKEEVRQAIAGTHPDFVAPPPFTIAHFLIKSWADGDVDDNGLPTR